MGITNRSVLGVLTAVAALSVVACAPEAGDDESGATEAHVERENDLFVAPGVLNVRISAPVSTLFARLKAGTADPPAAPVAGKPAKGPTFSEPAKLIFNQDGTEKSLDLRLVIRGESSKTDCPFPKLKFDFADKEQLKKTPFKGHGEVRINTHCGPGKEDTRSALGRVMHGVGPVREELTYRMIRAMGIETYRTRVLKVTYEDTATKEQIDTFAMAMESSDDAAQRLIEAKLAPEGAALLESGFLGKSTPENEADVAIAESFAGNKDWGGSHNVDWFAAAGSPTVFKIPQDFDLGAVVLGDIAHYWKGVSTVADAKPSLANATVQARVKAAKTAIKQAFIEAEKAAIEAKAVPTTDGTTTTDPGFVEARNRMEQLLALDELK